MLDLFPKIKQLDLEGLQRLCVMCYIIRYKLYICGFS